MHNDNTITYKSEGTFYDGVAALIVRGLTFQADYESLTIKLTGGC